MGAGRLACRPLLPLLLPPLPLLRVLPALLPDEALPTRRSGLKLAGGGAAPPARAAAVASSSELELL
jgi:hypothetical protein